MRRLPVCLLLLLAPLPAAAQLIDESWESGGVFFPWSMANPETSITFGATMSAAHRGMYGARLDDAEGQLTGALTAAERPVVFSGSELYTRAWVRVNAGAAPGLAFFELSWGTGNALSLQLDSQGELFLEMDNIDNVGDSASNTSFSGRFPLTPAGT